MCCKMCRGCIEGGRQAAGIILMDAPMIGTVEDLIEAADDCKEWNSLANSICLVVRKQRKHNKDGIDISMVYQWRLDS